MIFIGDIAIPYKNAIDINIPPDLSTQSYFGNLEGGIINKSIDKPERLSVVFNDLSAIGELNKSLNFKGLALANNHILDLSDVETTISQLNSLSIPFCGAGASREEATTPLVIKDNDTQIVILNFGWEVIQCEIAYNEREGVNPLTRNHVLDSVRAAVNKYPDAKIITYMHWSYELEAEPQPMERELAKRVIDFGASGVIGSHPHRVGGFELYKGRPIVYSLGNWMFKQNYYFDGKLSFPDFCNLELAFEWNFANDYYKFHFFEYNGDTSELTYLRTEGKESPTMIAHTPFLGLSDQEYRRWYKKNHYHKNKGLPTYYWSDSDFTITMKNRWNKTRDYILKALLNKGK